jgi:hypothetical protein
MNKQEYMARLQAAIQYTHNCGAVYRDTVVVREMINGTTPWEGDVQVFELTGHPAAKRCYGWLCGQPERFITILELPPVTDAQSAVKLGMASQIKKPGKRRRRRR